MAAVAPDYREGAMTRPHLFPTTATAPRCYNPRPCGVDSAMGKKPVIQSMTAFGRAERQTPWGAALCEMRSVNHRYLEVTLRLPDDLRVLEPVIRDRIAARLGRGKVECMVRLDRQDSGPDALSVNAALVQQLLAAARALPMDNPAPLQPLDVLRWPGVLGRSAPDLALLSEPVLALVDATLDLMVDTRRREGARIRTLLLERCTALATITATARKRLPEIIANIRERYLQRARELDLALDQERLEQEILLLVQKLDVAEELDRLEAHVAEVQRVLDQPQPAGRRLDFLMQELNREANTLGSKAGTLESSNASVDLKVLIEQMREQVQNVE